MSFKALGLLIALVAISPSAQALQAKQICATFERQESNQYTKESESILTFTGLAKSSNDQNPPRSETKLEVFHLDSGHLHSVNLISPDPYPQIFKVTEFGVFYAVYGASVRFADLFTGKIKGIEGVYVPSPQSSDFTVAELYDTKTPFKEKFISRVEKGYVIYSLKGEVLARSRYFPHHIYEDGTVISENEKTLYAEHQGAITSIYKKNTGSDSAHFQFALIGGPDLLSLSNIKIDSTGKKFTLQSSQHWKVAKGKLIPMPFTNRAFAIFKPVEMPFYVSGEPKAGNEIEFKDIKMLLWSPDFKKSVSIFEEGVKSINFSDRYFNGVRDGRLIYRSFTKSGELGPIQTFPIEDTVIDITKDESSSTLFVLTKSQILAVDLGTKKIRNQYSLRKLNLKTEPTSIGVNRITDNISAIEVETNTHEEKLYYRTQGAKSAFTKVLRYNRPGLSVQIDTDYRANIKIREKKCENVWQGDLSEQLEIQTFQGKGEADSFRYKYGAANPQTLLNLINFSHENPDALNSYEYSLVAYRERLFRNNGGNKPDLAKSLILQMLVRAPSYLSYFIPFYENDLEYLQSGKIDVKFKNGLVQLIRDSKIEEQIDFWKSPFVIKFLISALKDLQPSLSKSEMDSLLDAIATKAKLAAVLFYPGVFSSKIYHLALHYLERELGIRDLNFTDYTLERKTGGEARALLLSNQPLNGQDYTLSPFGFYVIDLGSMPNPNSSDKPGTKLWQLDTTWKSGAKKFSGKLSVTLGEDFAPLIDRNDKADFENAWKDKYLTGVMAIGSNLSGMKQIVRRYYTDYLKDEGFTVTLENESVDVREFLKNEISSGRADYFIKEAHSDSDDLNIFRIPNKASLWRAIKPVPKGWEVIYIVAEQENQQDKGDSLLSNEEFATWIQTRFQSGQPRLTYFNTSCSSYSKAINEYSAMGVNSKGISIIATTGSTDPFSTYPFNPFNLLLTGFRKGKSYPDIRKDMEFFKVDDQFMYPQEETYKNYILDQMLLPLKVKIDISDENGKPYYIDQVAN